MSQSTCVLCGRTMKRGTTEHHLIPRKCHKNRWFQKRYSREEMRATVDTCRDCHNAIHRFVPCEKELGRSYNTVPLLLAHPQISKFVNWIRKQK